LDIHISLLNPLVAYHVLKLLSFFPRIGTKRIKRIYAYALLQREIGKNID